MVVVFIRSDSLIWYYSAMASVTSRLVSICRTVIIFLCIVFSTQVFATATSQYCNNSIDKHQLGLRIGETNSSQLDTGSQVVVTTEELAARLIISNQEQHSMTIGLNFQYTIIDFDNTLIPMTNGHLHTWDFPVSLYNSGADYELSYYLVPAISFSSNVMRDPKLADREGLQLGAGIIYKKAMDIETSWLLGFRSDHRFGGYRGYPVVGLCWSPTKDWQLQLALPDFSIRKVFSEKSHLKLFVEPRGSQWHVFSKDKTRDSDFTYDMIVTGLSVEWHISSSIILGLGAEKHTRRRFNFVLDNGVEVKSKAESSTAVVFGGEVLF